MVMKIWKLGLVGACVLSLSACASYNVAGQFEDTGTTFYGTVSVFGTSSGSINVVTADGRVTCQGRSMVTKRPSLTTMGAQGSAEAQCSDGTSFKVDFVQGSSSGGHGQGISSTGGVVQLFFDTSKTVVKSMLEQQQLDLMVR
ncbi:MAG: hypothetical protein OQK24_03400 [Magnetovibrio sp.]|nr:hypothetical protein [Magnetovibrio sp.]